MRFSFFGGAGDRFGQKMCRFFDIFDQKLIEICRFFDVFSRFFASKIDQRLTLSLRYSLRSDRVIVREMTYLRLSVSLCRFFGRFLHFFVGFLMQFLTKD